MSEATVFCKQCGQAANDAVSFCTRCGGTLSPVAPGMATSALGSPQYGGFGIRFVARLIDWIVVWPVFTFLFVVLTVRWFSSHSGGEDLAHSPDAAFFVMRVLMWGSLLVAFWLYEALLTSSSKQGTLGKMAMRLKVTDSNGARLSFAHASGRSFAKMISGCTFGIGYIMVAFTERKQALHDIIAGTLVIRD